MSEEKKIKELEKRIEELEKRPYSVPVHPPVFMPEKHSGCLHDNCPGCANGTCNGVHMISCPCKKCNITC